MKRIVFFFAWVSSIFIATAKDNSTTVTAMGKQSAPLAFIENIGQVKDQNNKQRSDIQFKLSATNGLSVFIGNGAIHYQFSKADKQVSRPTKADMMKPGYVPEKMTYTMNRMDVELIGANTNANTITEGKQDFAENYFTDWSGEKGAMAHTYNRITYKDVYPNIDWVFYMKDGQMKHEFVVHEGGNVSDIKLKYGGANALRLNKDGSLSASTPQGTITENAPTSFDASGRVVNSKFILNDSVLSYGVDDYSGTLTIDPGIVWATYFGGSGDDISNGVSTDNIGNVIIAGYTSSVNSIATTGAFQTNYSGGVYDVYISKFTNLGAIVWSTYYGGSGDEYMNGFNTDSLGNIYLTGNTGSYAGIASSGAYQPSFGGSYYSSAADAFIAKFSPSGNRIWSTYYGGSLEDYGRSVVADNAGNVYVVGYTCSFNGIASSGAHQTSLGGWSGFFTFDAFLVKFDNTGGRVWGTYYGGTYDDVALGIAISNSADVYIVGYTQPSSNSAPVPASDIATAGSFQSIYAGGQEGFLVRFNSSGIVQWGTFYGGSGDDVCTDVAVDSSGNIYIGGQTSSSSAIASVGAFQSIYGGGNDCFVAKLTSSGSRLWGTYLGGAGAEYGARINSTPSGEVFFTGQTASVSNIATPGAYQTTYGGGAYDAFIAEYSNSGVLQSSSYFGGSGSDVGVEICSDNSGNIYVSGNSNSVSGIATTGAYQSGIGGSQDAYLAKFSLCSTPTVSTVTGSSIAYLGTPLTLSDSTAGGVWSSTNAAIANVSSSGVVTPVSQGVDTIKYTVTNSCGSTTVSFPITIIGSLPCYLPTSGLVAWYPFSGNANDGSGNGNNGTNYGASLTTDRFGNSNTAYSLDGISNFISVPNSSSLNPSDITINLWINIDTTNIGGWFINNVNPIDVSTGSYAFGNGGAYYDTLYFQYSTSGCSPAMPYTTKVPYHISRNNWTMVTVSMSNSGTTSFFINGSLIGSQSGAAFTTCSAAGQSLLFGKWWNGDPQYIKGKMDDIGIWNRVLTPCEISQLYSGSCAGAPLTAGTITGLSTICQGNTTTLSDTTSGGSWTSSNTAVATVSSTGVVSGLSSGSVTITYAITNACGSASATKTIIVNPLPTAGVIAGSSSVCVSSTLTLSDSIAGGSWSASNANAVISSGGVVYGITPGTDTIKYTVTNSCGTATATKVVSVNPLPSSASITGLTSVCVGSSITLFNAVSGGTWSSSNTSVASVGITGIVTGLTAGTSNISYSVTNTCGTAVNTIPITVNSLPNAGTIAGSSSVCVGANITLTDAATGGLWTSTNSNASVVSGTVYGVAPGTDTINYVVSNGCGTATAIKVVTINAFPNAGSISGLTSLCAASNITLTDGVSGGTWSSSNTSAATISSTGVITGVATGTTTISYAVTNGCGTATATYNITVNALPTAGTITGLSAVCAGNSITLSDATIGGVWTSSNGNAFITSAGVVYGTTPGTDTISYTVTNTCGTVAATKIVTINALPNAGVISGASSVCAGNIITLVDGVTGGIWSSSNTTIAAIGSTGAVTAVTAGSTTISYAVTNTCGTAYATQLVSVNPQPSAGTISGLSSVCSGNTITLTDATTGGTWTVYNTNASVSSTGVITGVTAGVDTVYYTVSNSCGSARAKYVVTVNPTPNAGTISGSTSLCAGNTITLTDAITGGTWSSSNTSVATITATGMVTGVTAGSTNISYTVTNSCGSAYASQTVIVNALPTAGTITGLTSVCQGAHITLSDATPGGVWNATNSNALITSTGVVYGSTVGIDTVTYTVTNGCGVASTSMALTINALPNAGIISGATSVCTGSTITLTNAISGGVWSVTNTRASITAGVVTGNAAGMDTVRYTVTNACGTAIAEYYINISPSPSAGSITGLSAVCAGGSITLSNIVTGGIWSASNPTANVIGGVVYGLSSGIDTISYTVTNGCGSATAIKVVTINPLPNAGTIVGGTAVCAGSSLTLTDGAVGGVWSATNGSATVSAGVVLGVTSGIDTIKYTVTNSCGTAVASQIININPLPTAGSVTGLSNVCIGSNITLTDATPGGTWSATNSNAGVTTTGVVFGINPGVDTIYYTVTNSCGSASAIKIVTILPTPIAGTITGASSVCTSATITLTDAITGGTWSSSNTSVATITATGMVTGVATGTTTISYLVTNACGSAVATQLITVNTVPTVASITGLSAVCQGANITLSDATAGGIWTATNANATITSTGVVHGVNAGLDTIKYSVTNVCGTTINTYTVTVNALPVSGTITGATSLCVGTSTTLTSSVPGGVWMASNGHLTLAGGVATGVSAGIDTVTYTVTNGCGTASTRSIISVNTLPYAGIVTGASTVCVGSNITLTSSVPGGTWTATNGNAIILSSGAVYGLTAGADTFIYNITNTCGSSITFAYVTVTPTPTAGTITGSSTVCAGSPISLTDAAIGGNWSSNNTSIATVSSTGVVNAVSAGTAIISYTVTNACGTAYTSLAVSANVLPSAGTITGGDTVCVTQSILLSDAASGGIWSTVTGNATISAVGLLSGLTVGVDTAVYTVSNSCGTAKAKMVVFVRESWQCNTTGINDVKLSTDINVVPNPNKGTFTISGVIGTVGDNVAYIEVTSMLGQSVYKNQILTHDGKLTEEIKLNDAIASGMYLLSIRSGEELKVFHIVVEQ